MSKTVEFTVCLRPTQRLRGMGCSGFLVTEKQLSPRDIEALRKFWKANADRLADGDTFVIDEDAS
jgi:hypothetical protein